MNNEAIINALGNLAEQEQRSIAADFADHVLPVFENEFPSDDRPRRAIEAARAYALGAITPVQLAAARDAAWAAAWDAIVNISAWGEVWASAWFATWASSVVWQNNRDYAQGDFAVALSTISETKRAWLSQRIAVAAKTA